MQEMEFSDNLSGVVSLHTKTTFDNQPKWIRVLHRRNYNNFNGIMHLDITDSSFLRQSRKIKWPFEISYNLKIVGYCNGLFCVRNWYKKESIIMLCNTLTYSFKMLPWAPIMVKCFAYKHLIAGLDPPKAHGSLIYGFGFDTKNSDFKVVRVLYWREEVAAPNPIVELMVYRLSTGCWEGINADLPWHDVSAEGSLEMVFLNSSVHWIVKDLRPGHCHSDLILSFDLVYENFSDLAFPVTSARLVLQTSSLFVSEGLLCLSCNDLECCCHIWVMEEYGTTDSWTQHYKIENTWVYKVIGIRKNGDILLSIFQEISLYKPWDGECKNEDFNFYRGTVEVFYVDSYVENLALISGANGL
ncbi:hypothetical protein RJ641_013463 [Dillenia turbinata]|uniref:F-box associated domain-containing protein n=1 Tax=Dillenia turbinata TaxID=194707 RepID=A0AAN8WA28_9MAGN